MFMDRSSLNERERVVGGEDADVAMGPEGEQVLIAGDDESGVGG